MKIPDYNKAPGKPHSASIPILRLYFLSPVLSFFFFFSFHTLSYPSLAFEFFIHLSFYTCGTAFSPKSNFSYRHSLKISFAIGSNASTNNLLYEYIMKPLFSDTWYVFSWFTHTCIHTHIHSREYFPSLFFFYTKCKRDETRFVRGTMCNFCFGNCTSVARDFGLFILPRARSAREVVRFDRHTHRCKCL